MGKNTPHKIYKKTIRTFWRRITGSLSKEQKEKIIPIELPPDKCSYCGSTDVLWKNSIVFDVVCDECVPRGCSCNLYKKKNRNTFNIEDYEYQLDKDGNEIPCEDWYRI